jgi:hypothetical protein
VTGNLSGAILSQPSPNANPPVATFDSGPVVNDPFPLTCYLVNLTHKLQRIHARDEHRGTRWKLVPADNDTHPIGCEVVNPDSVSRTARRLSPELAQFHRP